MQPVKVEVDLHVAAVARKRFSHGRYKTERLGYGFKAMVYGFRRCRLKDRSNKEYIVHVLAEIPSGYRCMVRRDQWVSEKLAWVNALIALNYRILMPFVESGDNEWRAEVPA